MSPSALSPVRTVVAAPTLPVLHRLAFVYLLLPMVIWLLGWFEWWFSLPAVALLGGCLGRALAGAWRGSPSPTTGGLMLATLAWVALTPAGGAFDGLADAWREHRAVLLDLGRYAWPTILPDGFAAYLSGETAPALLRYSLGWHMAPGLVARVLGPAALSWTVPLWTWFGLSLVAALGIGNRRGMAAVAQSVAPLVLFGCLDCLRMLLLAGEMLPAALRAGVWLRIVSVLNEPPVWTLSLLEMPQHIIPAGLSALLFIHLRRQPRFLAVIGIALATMPFWSVPVAVGLLPLAAVLLWTNGLRPFLRWPNLILPGPLAVLLWLYLASDTQYGIQGAMAVNPTAVWDGLRVLWPFHTDAATFLRQAALPILFAGAYGGPDLIARLGAAKPRGYSRSRLAVAGGSAALGIGAAVALGAIVQVVAPGYRVFPYASAELSTLVDLDSRARLRYSTQHVPVPLRGWLRAHDGGHARRNPGVLLLRADYDLYLDERRLVYVNERCGPEDLESGFFLHLIPSDRAALSPEQRRRGFVDLGFAPRFVHRFGSRCVALRTLPAYALASVRTGQQAQCAGNWGVEIAWDAAGNAARAQRMTGSYYRSQFLPTLSGQRVARGRFDVCLGERALTYVKEPCTSADTEASFFLHVFPSNPDDLPRARRRFGFDALGFEFDRHGVNIDGFCTATVKLPAYPAARIRTGQWIRGRGRLWTEEFPVHRAWTPPRAAPAAPLNARVAKWFDNHAAAVTIAYDGGVGRIHDGDVGRAGAALRYDPFDEEIHAMKHGLILDYEVVTALHLQRLDWTRAPFDYLMHHLVPKGFGYFGHGHWHVDHDQLSYAKALESFRLCFAVMRSLGMQPIAYAYPRGAGWEEETQRALADAGFLSGRLQASEPDRYYNLPGSQREPDDWFALQAVPMESAAFAQNDQTRINDNRELRPVLDEAVRQTAWLILTYHNIGSESGYGWYDADEFEKDLQSIAARDFWNGTMNDVTLYARERENVSLVAEKRGRGASAHIAITLVDGLDNARFNQPLTVLLDLPPDWVGQPFAVWQDGVRLDEFVFDAETAMLALQPNERPYVMLREDG